MRILLWCELYRPDIGGAEVWAAELARAMRARGPEVAAIACNGPKSPAAEDCFEGVRVHRFPFHRALLDRDLKAVMTMTRAVAELKRTVAPDLIHINTCRPSLLYHERTHAGWPCPTLVTVHEPPIAASGGNSLLERVLSQASWVTGVSHAMLDDARKLAPGVDGRSSVVYNALPEWVDEPQTAGADAPFLCVGRLVEDKGIDLAIRALAALDRRHDDLRLVVVGDGEARAALQALAANLGVGARVAFEGWVDPADMACWYRRARALVVPSRWREPFGLVVLEAAEAARPVIATRTGGLAEIVEDGVTGYQVPVEDVGALADAMKRVIEEPDRAAEMGRAGRNAKRDRFGHTRFIDAYEQLYERVVNAGASR
jgi:glycogen(starch) synthase